MSREKYFCLTCKKANMGCKCDKDSAKRFYYWHRLRVPRIKNKVVFRKFLDDCPQFVNCVPDEFQSDFVEMLRDLKYFNKKINGQEWTFISV